MAAKTGHEEGDSMPDMVKYPWIGLVTCYAARTVAISTIRLSLYSLSCRYGVYTYFLQ